MNKHTHLPCITLILALILLTFNACTNEDPTSIEENETAEQTITGLAEIIEYGKDGYTAHIKTSTGSIYQALVSISNMGKENYASLAVGDQATLKGTVQMLGTEQHMKVSQIIDIERKTPTALIADHAFDGISPGDKISKHTQSLIKEKLRTPEGLFDVYRMVDKSEESMAYLMPDPRDETLVGNITVDSPKAVTIDGFHIGTTMKELLKKYPDLEVHGSEIEGRTYALVNNLSLRLNVNNFSYEVETTSIPNDTKVTEIIINR